MKALLLLALFSLPAFAEVQSEFRGPVRLKVWRHWQQSWNVENATGEDARFIFTRGTNSGAPYAELRFRDSRANLQAQIRCDGYQRSGTWNVEEKRGQIYFLPGKKEGEWMIFSARGAGDCLDKLGERIVTTVEFEISAGGSNVFSYQLKPMYVRGSKNSYWKNPIDPHSAHAGSGQISVATSMSAESGWDKWDGTLVKPVLNFVDRNTLSANSLIGLHRHEANQELYFVESGQMKMVAGVASRAGDNYRVRRQWEGKGQTQETDEFLAEGGWIEERTLTSGEISVIVPNGAEKNAVYFHGIQALNDSIFWTMGSKN